MKKTISAFLITLLISNLGIFPVNVELMQNLITITTDDGNYEFAGNGT